MQKWVSILFHILFSYLLFLFILVIFNGLFEFMLLYCAGLFFFIGIAIIIISQIAFHVVKMEKAKKRASLQKKWYGIGIFMITLGAILVYTHSPEIRSKAIQIQFSNEIGKYGLPNLEVKYITDKANREVISWENETDSEVIYDSVKTSLHVFEIADLFPNSSYLLYIKGLTYRYQSPPFHDLRFCFLSDLHLSSLESYQNYFMTEINAINPHYTFILGDLVNRAWDRYDWEYAWEYGGELSVNAPYRLICGNHDNMLYGIEYYHKYFASNTTKELNNHYEIGDIHVIELASFWSNDLFNPDLFSDVESLLKAIPESETVFILSHAPFLGSDSFDISISADFSERFTSLFEEYGADFVFSGHQHHPEYLQKAGVHYFNIGFANEKMKVLSFKKSPYSLWDSTDPLFLSLFANSTDFIVEYHSNCSLVESFSFSR